MGKVITDKTIPKPIGITLPIQDGNSGYFAQSFDTLTQIKTNIINLLNTRQGERRFQPLFGTRLWNLVFNNNIDTLKDEAVNMVSQDVSSWISNITIKNISTDLLINDEQDTYMLKISLTFTINLTKQTDTVIVNINNQM